MFDAGDCCILELIMRCAVLVKRSVGLTSAKNYAFNLFGRCNGLAMLGIGDDPLEMRVADEVFDIGASERVAKEGLGEEDDQS